MTPLVFATSGGMTPNMHQGQEITTVAKKTAENNKNFFFQWNILVIFCWDILVTETLGHLFHSS